MGTGEKRFPYRDLQRAMEKMVIPDSVDDPFNNGYIRIG